MNVIDSKLQNLMGNTFEKNLNQCLTSNKESQGIGQNVREPYVKMTCFINLIHWGQKSIMQMCISVQKNLEYVKIEYFK